MTPRLIIGAIALAVVSLSGMWSSIIWLSMVDDVNRTRPAAQQFQPVFWTMSNRGELLAAYRKAVPRGRKHLKLLAVALLMGVGLIAVLACIGVGSGTDA